MVDTVRVTQHVAEIPITGGNIGLGTAQTIRLTQMIAEVVGTGGGGSDAVRMTQIVVETIQTEAEGATLKAGIDRVNVIPSSIS